MFAKNGALFRCMQPIYTAEAWLVPQVMTTAVKLMGRKEAKEEAADLVDQVDRVQKKFDDGAAKGSHASFKTAASGSRR